MFAKRDSDSIVLKGQIIFGLLLSSVKRKRDDALIVRP